MDKPLFDSDVDPKRIRRVADGLRRQGEFESARMLDAYADRIETREKAVPFAFTAQFEDGGFSGIWKDINDVVNWHQPPIPLYTHPAPADAERLAEALRAKIKEWRGAYHHVTEFDRGRRNGFLAACDSLERLLSTHPAQAQPLACNELPGMWSHSDFIGGDPDERSYAERTAQPPADQILDGVDIDFAESFERKEQPPAARVTDAMKRAFEHLASIGYPKNARGNYDKDGEWTFSEAVPRHVDAREVSAASTPSKPRSPHRRTPMGDLDTLRPEVREAVERMIVLCAAADKTGKWVRADCDVVIIAELLRLTRENEDLRSKCNVIMSGSTRHLGRAERAEAELAALKARIADGWLCGVSNDACPGNFDAAIYCLPSRFRGKRARLLVDEPSEGGEG